MFLKHERRQESMTDLEPILALWRELEAAGADYVLATVVAVEGSSYRRPGAHMLLANDGRRSGTVSGGCLEADVAKRAWWLTENGPTVERFSTVEEDGERPYGSGCGGVVHLLLERRKTAAMLLAALQSAFNQRAPMAIATILDGPRIGGRAIAFPAGTLPGDSRISCAPSLRRLFREDVGDHESKIGQMGRELQALADLALEKRASFEQDVFIAGEHARVWADYRKARPGLWVFGAGDDAKPLLHLARELGWFVALADGRSHLATRDRFPAADEIRVLDISALAESAHFDLRPTDAAVVMTHSFEQDSRILASLLAHDEQPAYIGVLGPQRRTRDLLAEAACLLNLPPDEGRIDQWLGAIHGPTGLDVGAETPAAIALSIVAEIQQSLNHGSGAPLRIVRAARFEVARS
jgi:xanthine dehydrogenase accessory factor